MKNEKLGEILCALALAPVHILGTLLDAVRKLCGQDGEDWLQVLKEVLQTSPRRLVRWVDDIRLPSTLDGFVVANKFVINTSDTAEVKISYLDGNFKSWFLGKIEKPNESMKLRRGVMTRFANDQQIIEDLGGEAKAETTLSAIYGLMANESVHKNGMLLNKYGANIFYAKDSTGILRTVRVYLDEDVWRILAYSVGHRTSWHAGDQVFSRREPKLLAA